MQKNLFPMELMPIVGKYLAQARRSRCMSIEQAAIFLKISPEELREIECGSVAVSSLWVQFAISVYGGSRGDKIEGLLFRWMTETAKCRAKTDKRKHLSIVGKTTRPWEGIDYAKIIQS